MIMIYDPFARHFCEHMLFLGTKKYPDENDFDKFLSDNGGSSNAYTATDNTNYFFDISPETLNGALDRYIFYRVFSSIFYCLDILVLNGRYSWILSLFFTDSLSFSYLLCSRRAELSVKSTLYIRNMRRIFQMITGEWMNFIK